MKNSYKFFANKACEYFPCHHTVNSSDFNCLFCYCPLYPFKDCGGNYNYLENGWKNCHNCLIPHRSNAHDYIINKLTKTDRTIKEGEKMSKVCVSYSLGKDSTLALYRTLQQGDDVIALIVAIDKENKRSWFHGVEKNLIEEVSKALSIPVIYAEGSSEKYRETFIKALQTAKQRGATACIFGDIDIVEHREWCTDVSQEANLTARFPLWQESRRAVVEEFINCGFKAFIKTVSKKHKLPQTMLGKTLSQESLDIIEQHGSDACGENGEYHTIVYDGPIFHHKINLKTVGIHESPYAFAAILELENA